MHEEGYINDIRLVCYDVRYVVLYWPSSSSRDALSSCIHKLNYSESDCIINYLMICSCNQAAQLHTEKSFRNLIKSTQIILYLPFSDWFGTKRTSVCSSKSIRKWPLLPVLFWSWANQLVWFSKDIQAIHIPEFAIITKFLDKPKTSGGEGH